MPGLEYINSCLKGGNDLRKSVRKPPGKVIVIAGPSLCPLQATFCSIHTYRMRSASPDHGAPISPSPPPSLSFEGYPILKGHVRAISLSSHTMVLTPIPDVHTLSGKSSRADSVGRRVPVLPNLRCQLPAPPPASSLRTTNLLSVPLSLRLTHIYHL